MKTLTFLTVLAISSIVVFPSSAEAAECNSCCGASRRVTKKTNRTYKPTRRASKPAKACTVIKYQTINNTTNIFTTTNNNNVPANSQSQPNTSYQPQPNTKPSSSGTPRVSGGTTNNLPGRNLSGASVPDHSSKESKQLSAGVHGSINSLTGNVTPEVSLSHKNGSFSVTGYAGIGTTGYKVTPAVPGQAAVEGRAYQAAIPGQAEVTENRISKFTPGLQFISAVHYDRSVFSWKDSNGTIQNTVKDRVFTEDECAEKKQWIENNGGVYYGRYTLKSGQTQQATASKTEYERVVIKAAVPGKAAVHAIEARAAVPSKAEIREALSGITYGAELGLELVTGVNVTGGAKVIGGSVVPTAGANLTVAGDGGFLNLGVRKTFGGTDYGTDYRVGGGLNF